MGQIPQNNQKQLKNGQTQIKQLIRLSNPDKRLISLSTIQKI